MRAPTGRPHCLQRPYNCADHINKLVKFQLLSFLRFGFRAFQSFEAELFFLKHPLSMTKKALLLPENTQKDVLLPKNTNLNIELSQMSKVLNIGHPLTKYTQRDNKQPQTCYVPARGCPENLSTNTNFFGP